MIGDLQRRLVELRFLDGIEKVEHVPYQTGDQLWVRFNRPLDFAKLQGVVKKHNYRLVKFAGLPSKLPKGLSEMLWNGVTHVIVKKISGWAEFTSSLGFEPDGIAKIASDLHGPYQIFIATDEDGIQVLYEYLDVKYVPPAPPPPKPVAAPAKPTTPSVTRPAAPQAPRPASPAASEPPTQPTQAPAPATPQAPTSSTKPQPVAQEQAKKNTTPQTSS